MPDKPSYRARGFTIMELMMIVTITGILILIAVPKFSELMRKSNEGSTRGNLGSIRSALNIYYSDMTGEYPSDLGALTFGSKYLTTLPTAKTPDYHAGSASVGFPFNDGGGWFYDSSPASLNFGSVLVNCSHTDTKNSLWSSY